MKKRTKQIMVGMLAGVALVAIAARLYLPYYLKAYVNRQIDELDGYTGGVDDIDVHLWRGAYKIDGLLIYKEKGSPKNPFFAAQTADLSVEWRALLNGAIVAEIDLRDATLNFTKSQTGQGAGWAKLVDALSPLEINRFEVHSGRVAYLDYTASPDVNIYIDQVNVVVKNLRAITDENKRLPSPVLVSGTSIGKGKLNMTGNMNILKDVPDFDVDAQLEGAALTAFNDYANEIAAVDFKSGNISIYAELAAANGRIAGYIKPIVTDVSVDVLDSNPLDIIWETLVSGFMQIFKNHLQDQFAMRIPVEGDINNPDRDGWSAFISIFQNAFGKAFTKDTDGRVNFNDAFLEKKKD